MKPILCTTNHQCADSQIHWARFDFRFAMYWQRSTTRHRERLSFGDRRGTNAYMSGELQPTSEPRTGRGTDGGIDGQGVLTQTGPTRVPGFGPYLNRPHAAIHLGEYLQMLEIQALFDRVPADPYVAAGF